MSDLERDPKPGDEIYVDAELYLWHGVDDFHGGKAIVAAVQTEGLGTRRSPGYKLRSGRVTGTSGKYWRNRNPSLQPSSAIRGGIRTRICVRSSTTMQKAGRKEYAMDRFVGRRRGGKSKLIALSLFDRRKTERRQIWRKQMKSANELWHQAPEVVRRVCKAMEQQKNWLSFCTRLAVEDVSGTYPDGRMADVWHAADLPVARTLAAVDVRYLTRYEAGAL
jgi:hypothetical protein